MPSKKHKPEEIIGKLREVEIVLGQSAPEIRAERRGGSLRHPFGKDVRAAAADFRPQLVGIDGEQLAALDRGIEGRPLARQRHALGLNVGCLDDVGRRRAELSDAGIDLLQLGAERIDLLGRGLPDGGGARSKVLPLPGGRPAVEGGVNRLQFGGLPVEHANRVGDRVRRLRV